MLKTGFWKGRKFTEEHRKRIGESNKGKIVSLETREKQSKAKKGKLLPLETKQRMSLSRMGDKHPMWGKHHSPETKRKIGLSSRGRKHSEESKRKIGVSSKGNKYRLGQHHSEETRKKMSKSLGKYYHGHPEKHYNWNGGSSFAPYTTDWTRTLRRSIRERDHYICQLCGIPQEDRTHAVHHIDYDKANCDPKNLITLCHRCHMRTNAHREYWVDYFGK